MSDKYQLLMSICVPKHIEYPANPHAIEHSKILNKIEQTYFLKCICDYMPV